MKNFDVVTPGRYEIRGGRQAEVLRYDGQSLKPDLRWMGRIDGIGQYWWCEDGAAYVGTESSTDLVKYIGPLSAEPEHIEDELIESLADAAESAAADFVESALKARRELRERLCMQMIRNREHMSADDLFDYADQVATRLEAIQ